MSKTVIKGWAPAGGNLDDVFNWETIWYPYGHTGPKNAALCLDIEGVYQTKDDMPGLELSSNAQEVTITIECKDQGHVPP